MSHQKDSNLRPSNYKLPVLPLNYSGFLQPSRITLHTPKKSNLVLRFWRPLGCLSPECVFCGDYRLYSPHCAGAWI